MAWHFDVCLEKSILKLLNLCRIHANFHMYNFAHVQIRETVIGHLLSETSLRLDTLAGSTWTLNWRCWETAPGGIHVVFNSLSKRKVCFFLIWTLRQTFTVDLSNLLQSTCKWVKISTVLMPGLPETENDSRGTLLLGKVGQVSVQEENGGFTIEENVST